MNPVLTDFIQIPVFIVILLPIKFDLRQSNNMRTVEWGGISRIGINLGCHITFVGLLEI